MSRRRDEFGDTNIAVVTFTDPARLADYREHLGVSFPIVADVERALYRALGLERGTFRQVWSFSTLRMYAGLLRRGRRLQRTDEDVRQLGADVVIGGDRRIVKIFRPPRPDARPSVDELLDAVRSAAQRE